MTHHQTCQQDNSLIHYQPTLCTHKFIFFPSQGVPLFPLHVNPLLIWQVQEYHTFIGEKRKYRPVASIKVSDSGRISLTKITGDFHLSFTVILYFFIRFHTVTLETPRY
jgi:hypothetical protein